MKRNRLTSASNKKSLFSDNSAKSSRRHNILAISALSLTGIFITSIVLAMGKPTTATTESSIIQLPNIQTEMSDIPAIHQPQSSGIINKLPPPIVATPVTIDNQVNDHEHELSASEDMPIDEKSIIEQPSPLTNEETLTPDVSQLQETEQLTNESEVIAAETTIDWQEVTVKNGDNLSLIFPRVGLSARDVYNVAQLGDDIKPLLNLRPGQVLRFDILNQEDSKEKKLNKLQVKLSPIETFNLIENSDGYQVERELREVEVRQAHVSATIKSSLFGAGINAGLSDNMIMQLAHIFGWDIDFALDLREGDHFTIIYTEKYLDGDKIDDGDILAAEFTNQGKTFRAVGYTDDSGNSQFYSATGESMRKAFSRTPVHFSRISSKFSPMRKHPKLNGVTRPHRGVDYAAKSGTPILATGDAKVSFLGRKGGYGRTVILSHAGKYTTLYAHMSRFKKGLKQGKRVKQGDVIGYVGMSGTATGPHLHYEFRVNGVHRNPLTVALPKAQSLDKKYQADFERHAAPLLAQLDTLSGTALALNN